MIHVQYRIKKSTFLPTQFNLRIKFVGQNTRGLGEKNKRVSVVNNLMSKGDIIMMQETHSTKKMKMILNWHSKGAQ